MDLTFWGSPASERLLSSSVSLATTLGDGQGQRGRCAVVAMLHCTIMDQARSAEEGSSQVSRMADEPMKKECRVVVENNGWMGVVVRIVGIVGAARECKMDTKGGILLEVSSKNLLTGSSILCSDTSITYFIDTIICLCVICHLFRLHHQLIR